jgi:hypothetical protein
MDAVRGRDGREGVCHPNRFHVLLEHERVRLVQLPPAIDDLVLVAELARCRSATELDKGGVCLVTKADQISVDAATLSAHIPVAGNSGVRGESSLCPARACGNVA